MICGVYNMSWKHWKVIENKFIKEIRKQGVGFSMERNQDKVRVEVSSTKSMLMKTQNRITRIVERGGKQI